VFVVEDAVAAAAGNRKQNQIITRNVKLKSKKHT